MKKSRHHKPPRFNLQKGKIWLEKKVRLFGSTKWGRNVAKIGLMVFGILCIMIGSRTFVTDIIVWRHFLGLSVLVAIFISALTPIILGAFFIFLARWLEQNPECRFYAVAFLGMCLLIIVIGLGVFGLVKFANFLLDGCNYVGWSSVHTLRKLMKPSS